MSKRPWSVVIRENLYVYNSTQPVSVCDGVSVKAFRIFERYIMWMDAVDSQRISITSLLMLIQYHSISERLEWMTLSSKVIQGHKTLYGIGQTLLIIVEWFNTPHLQLCSIFVYFGHRQDDNFWPLVYFIQGHRKPRDLTGTAEVHFDAQL